MKALQRISIAAVVAFGCFAGSAAAQTVVVGTGNPDIDIDAVQTAVDRGGAVVLRGRFSFENPPSRRVALPDVMATILVSKEVRISGTWDEHGQMTTIEGGEIPFAVEAHEARVSIERLRFVRPKLFAVFVTEVSGLAIESCAIENVQPLSLPGNPGGLTSGLGIYISTVLGLPTADQRGVPSNVSGKLSILNNQISGGERADHGMGIMLGNLGSKEAPVDAEISGNIIHDTAFRGINAIQVVGQVRIEGNIIAMRVAGAGRTQGLAGIHCGGSGSYRIAHNQIEVSDPNAAGIHIRDYPALGVAVEHAIIADNDVTLSPPDSAALGVGSAGIEILGLVRGSVVQRNRIMGRARVGLAEITDKGGTPVGSTFEQNDHRNLISPRVDAGAQK